MATYVEIAALWGNNSLITLRQKISVAIAIKANAIAGSANPTAPAKEFAKKALADPDYYQQLILNYILAEYNTQTVAAISGASDNAVQTSVNAAIDTLLGV